MRVGLASVWRRPCGGRLCLAGECVCVARGSMGLFRGAYTMTLVMAGKQE